MRTRSETFKFIRARKVSHGRFAHPSTDAIGALQLWTALGMGRSGEILSAPESECLVVRVTYPLQQGMLATSELQQCCLSRGIEREPVPEGPGS
ncbi:hypothetical protein HNP48_004582 [Acidovorax soli]|uniref:Uncharacterized protein n=1 Tax=Acidovorax soli TaxID=592050 RepID=A0A7X0PH65_9BURK|nr:hypothetical protein [Acidovorax soli]MBB6561880.1 hypothetical protein [Acidovorax soli]